MQASLIVFQWVTRSFKIAYFEEYKAVEEEYAVI